MVFAKNEDGGILPQSRRVQRNAAIAKGYAEANKNYQAYSDDLEVLKDLNKQLDNNGQAITDNEQRMAKANEVTKNASQRAKDYGKQIATNAKTLTDFKRENEVEKPDQQKQGKWSDGLKSMASAGLSMIGNAFISAGVGMLVQGAFSLLGKGIDAFVHKNENLIAKGQEAKESIQSQTKAYEDQKASLGELTSKYTELSKGVKISGNSIKNISLTDDEYKDFLDTSNQIAAAAPSLTRSWDSQGNAILNAGTNAEDLNTQVNDYLKLQRNLTYYDTKKNISDQYKGYETALGENKGKQDEYKNAYDAAKYKVDSVQKFSDMLKKHTKGEDTITYTLDQTAYDALGNTFGKAIKGYKQSADGQKITLEFDGKQLDFLNNEAASVLNSDNSELQEAHTNLVNTQESIDASKREMVSSIKSMASTIDSFDSWDDQDKASEFQSQLNSMLSSSDGTRLLDNFKQSGKDMDTWLRNNVVNPMATATPDQQKLWSQLFEMEPKDQETVREFAARRDDVLESIAGISQSDFWTKGTLAEAFGFAHTEYDDNDKAYTVWENQDSTFDTMIGKSADFNTSLIQQIKALETISNMKVTLPYGTSNGQGGSTTGNNTYTGAENGIHNTFNSNKDSTGAGNETPGTVNNKKYSLKLNATDIYLTYDHIKQQLKATWSPSKPEHSDIEWKSSDESIAKVSSDGTVRGVSSGLDKNGLMARDESKTRKCIITAIGGGGLAKATCTVHVMPNAHYEAIKSYAANAGIDVTSGDNLRAAMQYAYQNGANHSYQSDVAVEGFKKAYLKDWTSSLPNRPDGATDIPSGVSQLVGYFNSKGKKVGPKEMQQLADILGISTPGVKKYNSWGSALKNQILQKYKSYGFATGGIINKLIPADMNTLLGKAIISNGDQGFIGAKVGESVMTEEFTRLLKPSIAAMNDFTNMFNPVTPTATNNDYTINNEVNINVANMSNDLDIQDVANKVSTIINKNMTRDWRKLR